MSESAADWIPERPTLGALRKAAADCRACRGKRRIRAKPSWSEQCVTATINPSAILRRRDDESRKREMALFVEDLRLVASEL
jgi:hypothetical protein